MKSELRIGSFAEKGLCMKNELANENSDLSLNLGTEQNCYWKYYYTKTMGRLGVVPSLRTTLQLSDNEYGSDTPLNCNK